MGESSYTLSAGLSYQATADLAMRAIYRYSDTEKANIFVAQVYYYKRI
jgi:opacity protein-like surface antigen